MKVMASLLAGAALAAVASAASAADFSGTWSASAVYQKNGQIVYTTTPVCTFQQTGNRISGTCTGPNALGPATGTASGSAITWQWKATANATGQIGLSTWKGTLGPDGVIRGDQTGSSLPGASAPFTAQRQ